jgi:hypothetical protein
MLDGIFDQPGTGFDSEDIHDLIFAMIVTLVDIEPFAPKLPTSSTRL